MYASYFDFCPWKEEPNTILFVKVGNYTLPKVGSLFVKVGNYTLPKVGDFLVYVYETECLL